MSAKLPGVILS